MKGRNLQIDGTRGVLAFAIAVYHIFYRFISIYQSDLNGLSFMKNWGTYCVSSFLIFSGFFLERDRGSEEFSLKEYYKKKLFRLYPLYAISLTIISAVLLVTKLPNNNISVGNYVLNLFMLNGFIGTPYIDGAHWYMTVIISSIIIQGFLYTFKFDDEPIAYIIIMILNIASSRITVLSNLFMGGYIGLLYAGVSVNRLHHENSNIKRCLWIVLLALGFILTYKYRGVYSVIGMGIGIILLEISNRNMAKVLERPLFQWLGGCRLHCT